MIIIASGLTRIDGRCGGVHLRRNEARFTNRGGSAAQETEQKLLV